MNLPHCSRYGIFSYIELILELISGIFSKDISCCAKRSKVQISWVSQRRKALMSVAADWPIILYCLSNTILNMQVASFLNSFLGVQDKQSSHLLGEPEEGSQLYIICQWQLIDRVYCMGILSWLSNTILNMQVAAFLMIFIGWSKCLNYI